MCAFGKCARTARMAGVVSTTSPSELSRMSKMFFVVRMAFGEDGWCDDVSLRHPKTEQDGQDDQDGQDKEPTLSKK